MSRLPLYGVRASSTLKNGTATVTLGPTIPRERWEVRAVTVTGLNLTVSVALNDGTVSDSTSNDARPTITDDTQFHIPAGGFLKVTWLVASSGLADGTGVTASVLGDRFIGE